MNTRRLAVGSVLAALLAFVAAAAGADTYWQHDPGSPGDWFDPANWTFGVPNAGLLAKIDNGGTAEILVGSAEAYAVILNPPGSQGGVNLGPGGSLWANDVSVGGGSFVQAGGENVLNRLFVRVDVAGTYQLTGGELSAIDEQIGWSFTSGPALAVFTQSGGRNTVTHLSIEKTGRYELTGGELRLLHRLDMDEGVLDFCGSSAAVSWDSVVADFSGGQILNASSASLTLGADALAIFDPGVDPHAVFGSYNCAGVTHTSGNTLVVPAGKGFTGCGIIQDHVQCRGTITAHTPVALGDELHLFGGLEVAGSGLVDLGPGTVTVKDADSGISGGGLCANGETVGSSSTPGSFAQSGGQNEVGFLRVYDGSRYELTGGTLQVVHHLQMDGELDFGGSSAALSLDEIIADFSDGNVVNAASASLTLGPKSLAIFAAGSDPETVFGTYSSSGLTHTAGTTLVVPEGKGFIGAWNIYDHVQCAGTIGVHPGRDLGLYGGLELSGSGCVELGDRGLLVDDEISGMSGGQLSGRYATIAYQGTGRFTHTAGSLTVVMLILGEEAGASGTYELSGSGQVDAEEEYVGGGYSGMPDGGTGHFIQSGGVNTVQDYLYVGPSGNGTYELGGTGVLSARHEFIGGNSSRGTSGTGYFDQTGGSNTAGGVTLGCYWQGATGTYTISAGSLSVDDLSVGGMGRGVFNITGSGAEITVLDRLSFGSDSEFTAVPGATIHMAGAALRNRANDAPALAGLGNLTLIFEGGPATVDDVEVAGADVGTNPVGWVDNFVLGTLQLGGAADGCIRLVDDYHNQNDGPGNEALYVDWIVLNPGARIDFNNLNLYFLNAGLPKQLFHGDATLDGCVDGLDYIAWSNHYLMTGMGWCDGDLTGDRAVDGLDYILWSNNYLQGCPGSPGPVPEPSSVVLLLAGLWGLGRRREKRLTS